MRWFVWLACVWVACLLLPEPAFAQGFDLVKAAEGEVEEAKNEADAKKQARLAKLQAAQGKKTARVVVLKWPDSSVGEDNVILQGMVRNQIGRPNAKFYPSIDLYQEGRRRLADRDGLPVLPLQQRGSVPPEVVRAVRSDLESLRSRLGRRTDDLEIAAQAVALSEEIWFNDRKETRELLFDLYVLIGRSVFFLREQTPPYFVEIGEVPVNYWLYQAAVMLWEDEKLGLKELEKRVPTDEVGGGLRALKENIEFGILPTIPLSFHEGGFFDAEAFAGDYTVWVNGIERTVTDVGTLMVGRGRIDVFLERDDGRSLSERVEIHKLDRKIYFIREVARQKLGFDLLNMLMSDPAVCTATISDDMLSSLAVFADLHPRDEIYVAVPRVGSPYDTLVWRYDRVRARLDLVIDRNRGFPIRFALLSSAGMAFNGMTASTEQLQTTVSTADPSAPPASLADTLGNDLTSLLKPTAASVPIDFQLRGHFNRFMFGFGLQFGKNITGVENGGGAWRERYQIKGEGRAYEPTDSTASYCDPDELLLGTPCESLKELQWQRLIYGTVGVVLLKDAGAGIGPRGYVRFGWYNAPHAFDVSGHIGFTEDPTFGKKEYKGRIMPLIDLDLFAGALIPFGDTLFRGTRRVTPRGENSSGRAPQVLPNFGFSFGAGLSF